jgi:hypothetical protein
MTAVRMACRLLGLSVTALAAVGCTTSGRAAISRAGERGPRNCNPHTLQSGYGFSREDATRLRSCSPFTNGLTAQERARIYQDFHDPSKITSCRT